MESPELIISSYRKDIVEAITNNQIVMIRGQSGCGKSTRVPQYIVEDLFTHSKQRVTVLLNQTMAIRALSDYMYGKFKMKISIGHGYKNDRINIRNAQILYLSTGLFINWIDNDISTLDKSDYLIMDDIHDRYSENDILLLILKKYMIRNKKLRLILMSSWLSPKLFSDLYKDFSCKLIDIKRIRSNIEIIYPQRNDDEITETIKQQIVNILQSCKNSGSILVLLMIEDVSKLKERLTSLMDKKVIQSTEILISNSKMLPEDKIKILQTSETRKIILANNILKSGTKIPNLKYLIDCKNGFHVDFLSVIRAENHKGILGHINENAKCIRLYDNPFSILFLELIKHKIDENIKCASKHLNVTLLLKAFQSRTQFYNKFINDLDNYFENAISLHEHCFDLWETNCCDFLRQILSLIYPTIEFGNYEFMVKFIIDMLIDEYDNSAKYTNLTVDGTCQTIFRYIHFGIDSFDGISFINENVLNPAIKRLLNLKLIEVKTDQTYQLTKCGKSLKRLNCRNDQSKAIYMSKNLLFPGDKDYFDEICHIIILSKSHMVSAQMILNAGGLLESYLRIQDEWKKNPNDEKFQSSDFKYCEKEIYKLKSSRSFYKAPSKINKMPYTSLTYLKWLLLSGFVYNLAIRIPNDPQNGFHIISDGLNAKLDEKYQLDVKNVSIILFLKRRMNQDEKYPFILQEIINIEYDEMAEFPAKDFMIDETFWNDYLTNIKTCLEDFGHEI